MPRVRSTAAQVAARREALREIALANQPATVRQVYYLATVQQIVPKTDVGYARVQQDLTFLRRAGELGYRTIVDSTRMQRKPRTFSNAEDALLDTAHFYRKSLWDQNDIHVEVWLEKDALAGAIYPVTSEYDVGLMVARGYSSLSFQYSAGEEIRELHELGKATQIYYLADFDPSGQDAARVTHDRLREFVPEAEIFFDLLAVKEEQIIQWNLPTRPTKVTDSRSINFGDESVELDAIPPRELRTLVREAIEYYVDQEQLRILKVAEESEQRALLNLARRGVR